MQNFKKQKTNLFMNIQSMKSLFRIRFRTLNIFSERYFFFQTILRILKTFKTLRNENKQTHNHTKHYQITPTHTHT